MAFHRPLAPERGLVGMASLLAGIARAPFAAVVLAGEIGGYSLLPLTLIGAFAAYTFTSPRGSFEVGEISPDKNGPEEPLTETALQTSRLPQPPASSDSP